MASECMIMVEDLVKKYGDFTAVDHISFCVRRGEIFGFLGPNGAGKTTTVRMLCSLTRITSGRAYISGYSVEDHKAVKRVIGVVPDISNLYAELSCWDNVVFCGEMYGIPWRERTRRAEELLKFFGLWGKRGVKFKNLSKGLKRRLTIAAALMHKPQILFLDEPTVGLDVLSKRTIWRYIIELNKGGTTIFLTTHNIYEAFRICHRVAVINHGKIVAEGTPEELGRMFSVREVLEISFNPHNPPARELCSIKSVVDAREERGVIKLIVRDPLDALEEIVRYAKAKGLDISMISLRGVDAEEVFLNIIGESK